MKQRDSCLDFLDDRGPVSLRLTADGGKMTNVCFLIS